MNPQNSNLLKKKRGNDVPQTESQSTALTQDNPIGFNSGGKQRFNNKNRPNQNFQQKKNKDGYFNNKGLFVRKRLICNYYINGACHKGNDCTFSHDAPQIKKPNVKM